MPDLYYDDHADYEDLPGGCDHCAGSTPEQLSAAANGGLVPVCACAIGQGAGPGDCVCGTATTEETD